MAVSSTSWKKGHKKDPRSGMKSGQRTEKGRQWDELGEYITGRMTEDVMNYIESLTDDKKLLAYLQLLEYFKPKLSRSEIKAEVNPVTEKIKTVYDSLEQEPTVPSSKP